MTDRKQVVLDTEPQAGPESPVAKRVLAIFAHPDDPEFGISGTVSRWTSEGHHITYCLVTSGDKGSDDPAMRPERLAEIREREQLAAANIQGVSDVIFLRHPDGMVEHTLDLRRDLTRVIRKVKPDILISGDPTLFWFEQSYINHPDHRAVAEAALGALFPAAGNRLYFPELLVEGLEPHKVTELYLTFSQAPDTWIDISPFIDQKIASLRAHASQMGDWDPEEMIKAWAREGGAKHDPPVEYAEAFQYFKFDGP